MVWLGHAGSAKEMENLYEIWSEDLKGREYLGDQNISGENIAVSREYYSLRVWTALKWLSTDSTVTVFKHCKGIWADPSGQAV